MKNNTNTESQISKLKTNIESYDRLLKRESNNYKVCYSKAGALVKLNKLTGNSEQLKEALEYYDTAIKLAPQERVYLADRSKLYVQMGNTDNAIEDIKKINELPPGDGGMEDLYLNNVVRDIVSLGVVKTTIQQLAMDGRIPNELAAALFEHAKVTEGLVVTVGDHSGKLAEQGKQIEELQKLVSKLQAGQEVTKQEVEKLTKGHAALESKVDDNNAEIKNIEEQMTEFVSKEEFEELKSTTQRTYSLFDGQIRLIEQKVGEQGKIVVHMDEALTKANIFNEVEIKEGLEKLEKSEGFNTPEYAYKFYWTLNNYILAHRMLSTGMIKGQAYEGKSGMVEKIGKSLSKIAGKALEAVPYAGSAVSIITTLVTETVKAYDKAKSDQIIKKVVESVSGNMLDKDLNLAIGKGAIEIAKFKAHMDTRTNQDTKLTKAKTWMGEKVENLLSKATGIKGFEQSRETKLAIQDVALFISSLVSSDEKLIEDNEDLESLGNKIAKTFEEHKIDKILESLSNSRELLKYKQKKSSSSEHEPLIKEPYSTEDEEGTESDGESIVTGAVTGVNYDNKLLNHLNLLNKAAKLSGISFNEAISQSGHLSEELVLDAIENNDPTLILAGLMSLSE